MFSITWFYHFLISIICLLKSFDSISSIFTKNAIPKGVNLFTSKFNFHQWWNAFFIIFFATNKSLHSNQAYQTQQKDFEEPSKINEVSSAYWNTLYVLFSIQIPLIFFFLFRHILVYYIGSDDWKLLQMTIYTPNKLYVCRFDSWISRNLVQAECKCSFDIRMWKYCYVIWCNYISFVFIFL